MNKQLLIISSEYLLIYLLMNILDSERSGEPSGFTMVSIFFYPVYKISTIKNAWISTYSISSFSTLDQDQCWD